MSTPVRTGLDAQFGQIAAARAGDVRVPRAPWQGGAFHGR